MDNLTKLAIAMIDGSIKDTYTTVLLTNDPIEEVVLLPYEDHTEYVRIKYANVPKGMMAMHTSGDRMNYTRDYLKVILEYGCVRVNTDRNPAKMTTVEVTQVGDQWII